MDNEAMAASARSVTMSNAASAVGSSAPVSRGRQRSDSLRSSGRSIALVPAADVDAEFAKIAKHCQAHEADLSSEAKQRLLWDYSLVQGFTADEYAKALSKFKPRLGS